MSGPNTPTFRYRVCAYALGGRKVSAKALFLNDHGSVLLATYYLGFRDNTLGGVGDFECYGLCPRTDQVYYVPTTSGNRGFLSPQAGFFGCIPGHTVETRIKLFTVQEYLGAPVVFNSGPTVNSSPITCLA